MLGKRRHFGSEKAKRKRVRPDPYAARPRMRSSRARVLGGEELKYLDAWASDVALVAPTDCAGGEVQPEGGCTGCLSAPAQGDGEQQRDGRKIVMKSLFANVTVRGSTRSDTADAISAPAVFVALVLDTQANGATVVSEQVFENPNDTAYVNTYPLRNLKYSSRYRVIAHKTLNLGPIATQTDGANTASQACQERTCSLSWKGSIPVTFVDTTANVTSLTDNAFHIIAFSTTTNFNPVISYNSRLRFVG